MTTWSLTPFFNELDLLEVRLAELDSVVDVHVICESTRTFTNQPKPLYFAENKERFAQWLPKIRHVVVDDMPEGEHMEEPAGIMHISNTDNWVREKHQRNALMRGCDDMADDDLVHISDLDEIVSAETFKDIPFHMGAIVHPQIPLYVGWMNWRVDGMFTTNVAFCSGATMKKYGPQHVVMDRKLFYAPAKPGWNMTLLGGVEAIKTKLAATSHHELNRPPFNTDEWISERLLSGEEMFGRGYFGKPHTPAHPVPMTDLPQYVQDNQKKFKKFIGPNVAQPPKQKAGWEPKELRPGITVVITHIPIRAALLERALRSVNNQSLKPECIIVETDTDRQGAAITRNRGLMKVETEWVAFLDDDDEMLPNHLRTLMMHQETTSADLIYPWFTVKGGDDPLRILNVDGIPISPFGVPFDDKMQHYLTYEGNFIPVTFMVRTSLARQVGGFPKPEHQWWAIGNGQNEDHGFLISLLELGAKFAHAPYYTWIWHHDSGNTSGKPDRW